MDNIPQTVPAYNSDEVPITPQVPAPAAPASPSSNQSAPSSNNQIYTVSDVNADITADTAAHARDQALMQAERSAYTQICAKLNAPDSATKIDDDSLSALVQSFEVQSEHLSAVRYIGVFTIRFKPAALQKKLGKYLLAANDAAGNNPLSPDAPKAQPTGPLSHLSVAVQTDTLASWTQIKRRLNAAPQVARIDMIDLGHGLSHIDLSYSGSINDLQQALTSQGLILRQNGINIWEIYDGSMVPR